MSSEEQTPSVDPIEEPQLEASRSKLVFWMVAGLVLIVAVGFAAVSSIGGSVLYYKTATEVVAEGPGDPVRLSAKLVLNTEVHNDDGSISFDVTDDKTVIHINYTGGPTTALQSAARPGAQMVAEGYLGEDGIFHSTNLLAKCPSKFESAEPSEHASAAA